MLCHPCLLLPDSRTRQCQRHQYEYYLSHISSYNDAPCTLLPTGRYFLFVIALLPILTENMLFTPTAKPQRHILCTRLLESAPFLVTAMST